MMMIWVLNWPWSLLARYSEVNSWRASVVLPTFGAPRTATRQTSASVTQAAEPCDNSPPLTTDPSTARGDSISSRFLPRPSDFSVVVDPDLVCSRIGIIAFKTFRLENLNTKSKKYRAWTNRTVVTSAFNRGFDSQHVQEQTGQVLKDMCNQGKLITLYKYK